MLPQGLRVVQQQVMQSSPTPAVAVKIGHGGLWGEKGLCVRGSLVPRSHLLRRGKGSEQFLVVLTHLETPESQYYIHHEWLW